MSLRYRYREELSDVTGRIYRPVGDIEFLTKRGEWFVLHPYIDSGADITLIPFSLGKLLGFEIEKGKIQQLRGIGGGVVPVILETITAKMGEEQFDVTVAWALIEDVPPLLGRLDIFDKFHVTFKQDEKVVIFEKIG